MAWSAHTAGVGSAREALDYLQRIACAKYVSAVAVTGGGTGYTDGDILTITHAGAHRDLKFVVACSTSPGPITGIKRINESGAFTNRLTAATVTPGQGGTGYATGDVVGVLGGTFTSPAKVIVAGQAGGVVSSVNIFEGGGCYTTPPSNGASTDSSIGENAGVGLKLDMTFSGLIATGGLGASGGTGSGATFSITLTSAGWTVLRSVNNYTFNAITDEKEIVLKGLGGTGAADPYVGFRSGTDGAGARAFFSISPMTTFNSLLTYDAQPNILNPAPSTAGGSYVQFDPSGGNVGHFGITPRYISGAYRAGSVSHAFFVGLLNPTGTVVESPFPMVVLAPTNSIAVDFDTATLVDIAGLTELYRNSGRDGPCYIWDQGSLDWAELVHSEGTGAPPWTVVQDRGIFPLFEPRDNFTGTAAKGQTVADGPYSFFSTIGRADGGSPTHALKPTPDSGGAKQELVPCAVMHSLDVAGLTDGGIDGHLPNVFWISAKKADGSLMVDGDILLFGNDAYVLIANGARGESYSFFARKIGG